MSSKTIGAACLVAGTTIGAGMLALPLTISALGLIGGTAAMVIIWFVMYLAGLYGLELNLRAGKGMTLGGLGQFFSGSVAKIIGDASLLILTYALMAAYLFGGASVLETFLNQHSMGQIFDYCPSFSIMTALIILILMGNLRWVDHHNRVLFIVMLGAIIVLMAGLSEELRITHFVSIVSNWQQYTVWQIAIPVIFTSFGYHIIQNMMVVYCEYDAIALKKAFFWGSLIPLVAYVSWVFVTLSILYIKSPEFYQVLLTQKAELGQLMQALNQATGFSWLQPLSWVVGLLAILTSAIGVGLAIISFWDQHLPPSLINRPFILLLTLVPPLLVGMLIPDVFIRALGFAGLILTIIAIFLPIYLLGKADKMPIKKVFYQCTTYKSLRIFVFAVGIIVVLCELGNVFYPV